MGSTVETRGQLSDRSRPHEVPGSVPWATPATAVNRRGDPRWIQDRAAPCPGRLCRVISGMSRCFVADGVIEVLLAQPRSLGQRLDARKVRLGLVPTRLLFCAHICLGLVKARWKVRGRSEQRSVLFWTSLSLGVDLLGPGSPGPGPGITAWTDPSMLPTTPWPPGHPGLQPPATSTSVGPATLTFFLGIPAAIVPSRTQNHETTKWTV